MTYPSLIRQTRMLSHSSSNSNSPIQRASGGSVSCWVHFPLRSAPSSPYLLLMGWIMKHCLLQYQTCEVSAELIGRENILPSSSGRAWSQKNGNGNGVGLDGKGRQIIWIRLEEKSAVNWKASAGGWNEDTVFWLVPPSMMEKQIRAKETWSLDKTLPLTNLDSVYSFAKL